MKYVTPGHQKIHGLSQLPKGYSLALLPSNTLVVLNKPYDNEYRKALTISSSASILQSIVAIFQVIYTSFTLYKTRGDQLNRYGYAAFGLTIIPYIIISFLNLVGNLSTPNSTLYLVGSPKVEEAKVREGSVIDRVRKRRHFLPSVPRSKQLAESHTEDLNICAYRHSFGGVLWYHWARYHML